MNAASKDDRKLLRREFSFLYREGDPAYSEHEYVEWLEDLVVHYRTRPDLQPHDEPHWPAEV